MLFPSEIRTPKSAFVHFWPLLLPLFLLLPGLAGFPYPSPEAQFSDFSISHYPNALFLQRSFLEHGQIPLWSPTILSGYPFAANPLASLWYPPHWLALLMPLPLGLNVVAVLHVLLGGKGMYLFLRSQDLSYRTALFGALAFEAMPKLFAHYGAGHLTTVYAVPWLPWLLLATNRIKPKWLQPGVVLAFIFLADVRWAAYIGLLWLAYDFAHSHKTWLQQSLYSLKQVLIAALLAALLALPLIEYTWLSTRASLQAEDVLAFSLPPPRLLGWLFPDFGGYVEWMTYAGITVFILAMLAFTHRRTRTWFWGGILLFSTLYSLGSNLPGLEILAGLPGFSLLRVPPRALVLTSFALIMLACLTFEALLTGELEEKVVRRIRLLLAGVATMALSLAIGIWVLTGSVTLQFIWGTFGVVTLSLLVFVYFARRISSRALWLTILSLTLMDLMVVGNSLFVSKPVVEVGGEQSQIAEYLDMQPKPFRMYSPSYSLPQQTAALYGLELVDGVDPLQLQSYADYMENATGVPNDGYSVTLPVFAEDPATANQAYQPDVNLLAALNVKYVAAEFDLDLDGLELEEQFGETRVYALTAPLPRAYILQDEQVSPTEIVDWDPNRIELRTDSSGLLVLSETAYPGWQVYVDGQQTEMQTYQGIFRAVQIAEGIHEVEFIFRPLSVYAGLATSLLTIVFLVWKSKRTK